MSKNNHVINIYLFLASCFFAIFTIELILRSLGLGYGSLPLDGSYKLHHEHPKNYKYYSYYPVGEYGGFNVIFNEIGNRTSENVVKYNSKKKIAFLGDSFTEAAQVDYNESFVGLTQRAMKIDVFNYGVSSYSPLIYLAQIKQGFQKNSPTDLILQVFENDFSDDRDYYEKADNKNLQYFTSVSGEQRFFAIKLLRHSYFARFIRRIQLQLKHYLYEVGFFKQPDNINDKVNIQKNDLTFKILKEIKNELKKLNINFHLIMIPNKQLAKQEKCCQNDVLYNEMKLFSNKNKIHFIDIAQSFQNYPSQKDLFFNTDIHLTEIGHLLVAAEIEKYFSKNKNKLH